MKVFLTSLLLLTFMLTMAQTNPKKEAACFLDSKLIHENVLPYFDPNAIQSVNVAKGDTLINGKMYSGKIFISTKSPNSYVFLSLNAIKEKYTTSKNPKTIFMINGLFIKKEMETYAITEDAVFKVTLINTIEFDHLKNENIDIVSILTKTEENLKKDNTIIIR